MAPCKLTYFNNQALGEAIRFLLHYGNIEFEDIRIDSEKDWPNYPKENLPLGQVPILEIDGKVMYQSIAICRYLAKKVGLAGTTAMEDYEIDNAVDNLNDFRGRIAVGYYEPNEVIKAEKMKDIRNSTVPFFLDKLETIAKQNNGHFALQKFTWADVYYTGMVKYLNIISGLDLTENRPYLKKVVAYTESLPGIKQWIDKRPETFY